MTSVEKDIDVELLSFSFIFYLSDSFAGAYLAMRLIGTPPAAATHAANRLAAVVIQHPGAIIPANAMPTTQALTEGTLEADIHPIE